MSGPRVIRYKSCRSTQETARRLAERGEPAWTLVRAERQRAGKGRMGRRWSSGPGGLYFSLILRPRLSPDGLGRLSLASAEACAAAIARATGLKTAVKPPNDVLAFDPFGAPRKVCGILLEAAGGEKGVDWLVAGIGVNVNNRVPSSLPQAASLSALAGRRFDRDRVLSAILRELGKRLR